MKKFNLLALLCLLTISFTSCGSKNDNKSYVTMEINPGVEMVLDSNGKVTAANGLNDDGKVLINEEEMVGLTAEAAINLVLDQSVECGFIVTGSLNLNITNKDISVSISCSSNADSEKLEDDIKGYVNNKISADNINASYKHIEEKTNQYFIDIAKKYDPTLTQEQAEKMTKSELLEVVELATIEKSELVSMELENYYLQFKEYEFKIKNKEEISAKLTKANDTIANSYTKAVEVLKKAIEALQEAEYKYLLSEESTYQKAYDKLEELKNTNLSLYVKVSCADETNTAELEAQITANNSSIELAQQALVQAKNGSKLIIDTLIEACNKAIEQLEELEKETKNIDYNSILDDIENSINDTKNGAIASFEEKYADDLENAKLKVKERKEKLVQSTTAAKNK